MSVVFALLFLLSSLGLAVGFASPPVVLPWTENKTRKRVVVTYGIATAAFAALTGVTASSTPQEQATAPTSQPDATPSFTLSPEQAPSNPATTPSENPIPASSLKDTSPPKSAPTPISPSNTRIQPSISLSKTNAVVVGDASTKNIRTGPGTEYEIKHNVYPGDRVQLLDSAQDSGGYTWYKVRVSKSGDEGWIAAQLIEQDGSVLASQGESPAPTSQVIPATSGTNNFGGSGRCDNPDDLDAAGKRCGKRAASERLGGR